MLEKFKKYEIENPEKIVGGESIGYYLGYYTHKAVDAVSDAIDSSIAGWKRIINGG